MEKITKKSTFTKRAIFMLACFFTAGLMMRAQTVLIPYTGSTSVPCGSNVALQAHNGNSGQYSNNANGYVVLNAGFAAVINISGTYTTEANYDYIRIYDGVGTGGTLLGTYHGQNLNLNYTGTAGQTLTVRFSSDGSVTYAGFNLNVTYTGPCFAAPCSGAPGANAVVTPTYAICPNSSAFLSLANSYTVGGLTYQWQSSNVSNVGPFTSVPNATNSSFTTPTLSANTFFQAIITCTNGNQVTTAVVGQVSVQPVLISTVPYLEDFEGLISNNSLPNCSWTSTSPGGTTRTYTSTQSQQRTARSGSKFASFYYSPSGSSYFFTNGIQLHAGITYSTSVWYATNYYGDLSWSDMSIMLGTSQSSTGLTPIVSTNGPAASSSYKALAGTFTVATSGIYYVAIKGTANGNCCAYHLNWDDLKIEIPCSLNSPSVGVSANNTVICEGESVILTATGADNYSWSNGGTGDQITVTPSQSTYYTVVGTNSISGCNSSMSQMITVNPSPVVSLFASAPVVCAGQPVVITAVGANTYTWSGNNGNSNFITVSPTVSTTYSVFGGNSFGCQTQASQVINVNALPNVTGMTDRPEICKGESATLTGNGAVTYQWAASSLFIQNTQAIISPNVSTTYTLTGTDANGCQKSTTVLQVVMECVGLNEMTTTLSGVKVYPNPTGGAFIVELNNGADKFVQVTDVTGRVVLTNSSKESMIDVDINNLSNGIYYVKIQSQNAVEVIKVIKN